MSFEYGRQKLYSEEDESQLKNKLENTHKDGRLIQEDKPLKAITSLNIPLTLKQTYVVSEPKREL